MAMYHVMLIIIEHAHRTSVMSFIHAFIHAFNTGAVEGPARTARRFALRAAVSS